MPATYFQRVQWKKKKEKQIGDKANVAKKLPTLVEFSKGLNIHSFI